MEDESDEESPTSTKGLPARQHKAAPSPKKTARGGNGRKGAGNPPVVAELPPAAARPSRGPEFGAGTILDRRWGRIL